MGYKSKIFAPKYVPLDDDYWVKVRPLTGEQESDASAAMLEKSNLSVEEIQQVSDPRKLNISAYNVAQMARAIFEWNVDDEDGVILEINEENVSGLSAAHQSKILQVVRGLNSPFPQGSTAKR